MSKAMQHLAAAYTGQDLPKPHSQPIGWPAQLRAAAEAAGEEVPEALLDKALYGPVPSKVRPASCLSTGVSNLYGAMSSPLT